MVNMIPHYALCALVETQCRFKLHLRPKSTKEDTPHPIPPLPKGKGVGDIFADYLRYLSSSAFRYIENSHGADMWQSLSETLHPASDENGRYPAGEGVIYILSHPNGWEGYQQQIYSQAAVKAGLLQDDIECLAERLHFVTEGEASLHWAMESLGSTINVSRLLSFNLCKL